jgi:hypothetical protein
MFAAETVENNDNNRTDWLPAKTKHNCRAFSLNKLCIVETGKPQ